ncbi:hypothetical protein niasHT_000268 [Heterodera trifolii]|uniref:Uncharacterized protein n=1 Tax=Heterodera trifolii TaxID=157864 RepID=A0ABD2LTD2_9BILA
MLFDKIGEKGMVEAGCCCCCNKCCCCPCCCTCCCCHKGPICIKLPCVCPCCCKCCCCCCQPPSCLSCGRRKRAAIRFFKRKAWEKSQAEEKFAKYLFSRSV